MKTELFKTFEIQHINEDSMRTAECWGSVEVLDRHGEIIPIDEVKNVMDIWMDRGAPIMYNHTHRNVGKGLNYQIADKDGKSGVLIKFKIYNHYAEDDEVWKGIKEGKFEGLSIGGKSYGREESEEGTILRDLIGYEFSVVERTGNQEATFTEFNALAKNEEKMTETNQTPDEVNKYKVMVESLENKTEDSADIQTMMDAVMQKIAMLESRLDEVTAGKPEDPEVAVEETKSEEEPEEEEEEEAKVYDENVKKEMEELKSQIASLTKSLENKTVVKTIETERPAEVAKSVDRVAEVQKAYTGQSRVSFKGVGPAIEKALRGDN